MSDRELRLRLAVRRHGVPEVKLVWNVPASPDWTISKLIAQVNEVIPLEAGEWGLEDYAVELKGPDGEAFECLHFQQVAKILKDDDQVIIRSLLTGDIHRRRLSGRHQISFDGKHLVDGLAFGRSWHRTPRDRPVISLPPRKRVRLAWDGEEDEEDFEEDPEEQDEDREESPLLLEYQTPDPAIPPYAAGRSKNVRFHADGENAGLGDDVEHEASAGENSQSSSDGSDDESLMAYDEESLLDELRDIQEDHAAVEGDLADEDVEPLPAQQKLPPPKPVPPIPAVDEITMKTWITTLKVAFPGKSTSEIKKTLIESHHDTWEAYRRLDRQLYLQEAASNPARPSNNPRSLSNSISSVSSSDSDSSDSDSDSALDNGPKDGRAVDAEDDSEDDSDFDADGTSDDDSSSESSSDSSSEDSDDSAENTPTKTFASHRAKPTPAAADEDGSENDDTVIRYPIKGASSVLDSDDSSSSSSDDSSSDSEPEELTSKPVVSVSKPQPISQSAPKLPSPAVDNGQPPVAPGRGMRKTQKRNLRRRLAKQATSQDQSELSINDPSAASTPVASMSLEEAEFLARKKALLDFVGVDTPAKPQDQSNKSKGQRPAAEGSLESNPPTPLNDASEEAGEPGEQEDSTLSAASRRLKLNVDAGRRMLFSALGHRTPKTKADEEQLRSKLMKDVRPHVNPRIAAAESNQIDEPNQASEAEEDEDQEAWRQKISSRAVECCDEGMELSEPPFPFVQRWDPQQQFDQTKKGKRKRPQRNAAQFCQEDDSQVSKKPRVSHGDDSYNASYAAEGESAYDDIVLQYDDVPEEEPLPTDLNSAESQISDSEDLPPVPADLSTLEALRPGEARPYMVITWKQWLLSPQTNWQPQLSDMTAVVIKAEGDDGTGMRLLLAMRDRGLDKPERVYDQGTGKRIYDKFEAPDMDEDEDEDEEETDDGYRDLQFSELIEPKILLAAGTQKEAPQGDSEVQETQYGEGQSYDEGPFNGYEDHAMADQPTVADDEQGAIDPDGVAVADNTLDSFTHDSDKPEAGHHPQSPNALPGASPSLLLDRPAESTPAPGQSSNPIEDNDENDPSPAFGDQDTNQEGDPDQHDEISNEQPSLGPQPSDVSSVPSGRQPDPDFSMDLAHSSPVPSAGADEVPGSSESTPKAKGTLQTPSKQVTPEPPSSILSLPSVSEIWATATSRNSQSTQSPSRAMAESALKSKILRDEEYEEAMRRIDDDEDDEEQPPATPKKQLFPNAAEPAKASFQVPSGTQVIAVSSDHESGGALSEGNNMEEDDDGEIHEANLRKGPGRPKKSLEQQKKEGKSRAVSMPAKSTKPRRSGRTSLPGSQTRSASKKGKTVKGRRAASGAGGL
ncbi:hypothetical protein ACHAQA_006720 [Verticillium albo-atrum]